MNKKLYVGNLSYDTTEERLRSLFSEVGPVDSVAVITDRETGRSKGFGFVEMGTEDAAEAAIERLNDTELDRRTIVVSEARPPRERSERSYGGGGQRRNGGRGGSRGRDEMY
ncbi:MAG: RNA-binding protein [Chloroflexi bacterium]|jgi:RNA recognition motif-containing protein|nr:RNA-binding protein [Chloroflexota bacterium]